MFSLARRGPFPKIRANGSEEKRLLVTQDNGGIDRLGKVQCVPAGREEEKRRL